MNKFNIVLKYIKKYIFWVISLVCLLVTMIVGNIVTGSKEAYFQTRESAIEGRFSEMQRLAGQDTPNDIVVTQKKEDVQNLKENILDAWMKLYTPQHDLFVNRWPEFRSEKDPDAFDQNAQIFQDSLKEAWDNQTLYDQQNPLSTDVANAYRDYVMRSQARDFMKRYGIKVPKLSVEGGAAAGNMGAMNVAVSDALKAAGSGESELPTDGKMTWDETNRQQMLKRFSILARNTGAARSNSTRKIFMVQEDIWAYDIILDAIAKMNANCEGDHDAVVKRIRAIDIADDASTLNTASADGGRVSRRENLGTASDKDLVEFVNASNRVVDVAEPKLSGDEELDMASMDTAAMEEEEEEASPDEEFDILFDNRYCDKYGNFMPAAKFREFLAGKPEYKMMPIHVQVIINQEQIPQLMLNCMNAAMPIYIHQISVKVQDLDSIPHTLAIVPEEKTTSEDGGLAGASAPKRSRYGNEAGGTAVPAGGMETMNVNALNSEKTEQKPEDVEFEFWGMICIFNRPDASKFNDALNGGEGGDSEESEDEESEDAESEDAESEDAESEDAESEDAESEDAESEDAESEDAESEDAESEDAESEDAESEDAESEDAESEDAEPEDADENEEPAEESADVEETE